MMVRDVTGGDFAEASQSSGELSLEWRGWFVQDPGNTVVPGHTYEFKVCGFRWSDGHGQYSQPRSYRVPDFSAPKEVSVSEVTNGIRISWNAVEAADSYELQRFIYGQDSEYWDDIVSWWRYTEICFIDTDIWPGITYSYRVRANSNQWWSNSTDYSTPVSTTSGGPFPASESVSASQGASEDWIEVCWQEVPEAEQYRVYRLKHGLGDPAVTTDYMPVSNWGDWTSSSGRWIYWEDSVYASYPPESGVRYYYRVRARKLVRYIVRKRRL